MHFYVSLHHICYAHTDMRFRTRAWCVAVCCSVLQCVAVCCSVLQCVTCHCAIFVTRIRICISEQELFQFRGHREFVAELQLWIRLHVLKCVAVCCSVWQCVAACCS